MKNLLLIFVVLSAIACGTQTSDSRTHTHVVAKPKADDTPDPVIVVVSSRHAGECIETD